MIPGVYCGYGNLRRRSVTRARTKLVEPSVVKRAKALKKTIDKPLALIRAICELMTVEVIDARWNDHVPEDIKGR